MAGSGPKGDDDRVWKEKERIGLEEDVRKDTCPASPFLPPPGPHNSARASKHLHHVPNLLSKKKTTTKKKKEFYDPPTPSFSYMPLAISSSLHLRYIVSKQSRS